MQSLSRTAGRRSSAGIASAQTWIEQISCKLKSARIFSDHA
jgi:hypothetical protein